jgi:hypothetical protein
MRAALFESLEENRDAIFRRRLPGLAEQSPQIVGQCVLFGELHIDHGEEQTLPVIHAHQEMRDDDILDISRVEFGEELLAQAGDGRLDIARRDGLAGNGRRL